MMQDSNRSFIAGVVEGFYGLPWNARQRHQLFGWLKEWGLNTFMYAPKDDLKHRWRWRELYDEGQTAELAALIRDCRRHGLNFIYAIGPGLDFRYADPADLTALVLKLDQTRDLGAVDFALLFDDIPRTMRPEDAARFPSFASAQAFVANEVCARIKAVNPVARVLFCPTEYCGRMAQPTVKDSAYLNELGELLGPEIGVFWTGPEIISETISMASIRELQTVLRRKPVIWDNLHANDYDMRRLYLGPYAGRPAELRAEVAGILSNPNCQFEANFVPIRTFARYCAGDASTPREAFLDAAAAWLPLFRADEQSAITPGDLELIGNMFCLPTEFGPLAEQYLRDVRWLFRVPPSEWGAVYQRFGRATSVMIELLDRLARIGNRELFHALYRYLWELREEVTLTHAYVEWRRGGASPSAAFCSPGHRPKIYRGGFVAALQHLLPMDELGQFSNAPTGAPTK